MAENAIFQRLDDFAPPELHLQVWEATQSDNWLFGNYSNEAMAIPFWKMELEGVPAIDALWQHAKPRCEEFVDRRLNVVRQYANGHTYGQGGQIHTDDVEAGTYTLIYYPMPIWESIWDGETIYQDANGEVAAVVMPQPNRAVFFDSRIPHAGRAPSRQFAGLRVTVAFKLEAGDPSA